MQTVRNKLCQTADRFRQSSKMRVQSFCFFMRCLEQFWYILFDLRVDIFIRQRVIVFSIHQKSSVVASQLSFFVFGNFCFMFYYCSFLFIFFFQRNKKKSIKLSAVQIYEPLKQAKLRF
uniref:(northern house mosquito) hypothetical protein n=1 Tax=Culex pipiens TaxID=7175 RepID=A0A8D8E865_CULPI